MCYNMSNLLHIIGGLNDEKIISLLLCVLITVSFFGCSKADDTSSGTTAAEAQADSSTIQTVLNQAEYVLYQNIFTNDQADDYDGQPATKEGTFAVLYDEYNSTTRYYVWGYNDQTKCCDWQWEIVPDDTTSLPSPGSLVEVTGTYAVNDSALDKFWIENADITVKQAYDGGNADVDMTTMGGTLERVQVINMQQFPDKFEGKSVSVYGRVESTDTIQHPYYDNCFSQQFVSTDDVQAIGTVLIVSGTYQSGVITDASVSVTNNY